MRRVIGMDIHRTFAEVVFWEDGKLRPAGRISMTRAGLEGFGRNLNKEDEVIIERPATPWRWCACCRRMWRV
jgi:transposase